MSIRVTAIRCPECKDVIWSRSRHDFRGCSCGEVAIDGGREYLRIVGNYGCNTIDVEVLANIGEVYSDYNRGGNRFGILKKGRDRKYQKVIL